LAVTTFIHSVAVLLVSVSIINVLAFVNPQHCDDHLLLASYFIGLMV